MTRVVSVAGELPVVVVVVVVVVVACSKHYRVAWSAVTFA
jgi:hypothetical protein